ncbi:hypothetical protein LDENG_00098190 [Lucifuga dentata]|nr:hypothetical protein LDENG_00098190 [Lucifuga dentata]
MMEGILSSSPGSPARRSKSPRKSKSPKRAKSPRRAAAIRRKRTIGLTLRQRILEAASTSRERKAISSVILKKVLAAQGYDVRKNNARINAAIKGLVKEGTLLQVKGTGASGSFKTSKKLVSFRKSPVKAKRRAKKKKAATRRTPKKRAKKPAARKSPKKRTARRKSSKSPKRRLTK